MQSASSWQAHADSMLGNKGFTQYGVYNHSADFAATDHMGVLARDPGLMDVITSVAKGDTMKLLAHGPMLAGRKYFVTMADASSASGVSGPDKFIAQKTPQTVVFVSYSEQSLKDIDVQIHLKKFIAYLAQLSL